MKESKRRELVSAIIQIFWKAPENLARDMDVSIMRKEKVVKVTNNPGFLKGVYWDIASIQKAVVSLGIVALVKQGKVFLDDPVSEYLPIQGAHTDQLTIRHLMEYSCDFKISEQYYTVSDLLTAGLRYEPGTAYTYRNSQHILLAEILRVAGEKVSLKDSLASILTREGFDFSGGFKFPHEFSQDDFVIRSSEDRALLPQDGLARWLIEEGKEQEPGHAGAFTTSDFLLSLGDFIIRSEVGKSYVDFIRRSNFLANEKTGLVYSAGASIRRGEFTGHDDFDREHIALMGYAGPAVYIWPEKELVVAIMLNSHYYQDPEGVRPDEVYDFRVRILRIVLKIMGL